MSWRDILKDAKTISQTSGSFDFEEEEIPEEDEKNCLKELKEYYDKAKNHPKSIERFRNNARYFRFSPIPEEVACAVVERIKSIKKSGDSIGYRKIDINDTAYWYIVRYDVHETRKGERYQKFRVYCYDIQMKSEIRFGTKSFDLNADIDFR